MKTPPGSARWRFVWRLVGIAQGQTPRYRALRTAVCLTLPLGFAKLRVVDDGCGRVETDMTKSDLIKRLAEANPHLFLRDIERIVSTVFDEIGDALADGNRVELRGFGAFSVRPRGERTGRNPRTGDEVQVPSKLVPYFKTGKELRERLNKG